MSTKIINTRIKLRVDTAANWAAHDTAAKGGVKIYKGEAALSLQSGDNAGKYEIRYGISDEGSYWADLTSSNFLVKAENVEGLLNSLYSYQLVEDTTTKGKFTLQKKLSSETTWTDVTSVELSFTSTGTYSADNPIALKDYVDSQVSGATTQYFEAVRGTVTEGEGESATTRPQTDNEVITKYFTDHTGITVKGGSTFVIKTAIGETGKYEYIAFTYDTTTDAANPVWRAMDGNYNAENVYFTKDIMATYAIGRYTPSATTGNVTIPTAGKNVYAALDDMLSVEVQGSVETDSSATFKDTGNFKAYEVGSTTGTLSYNMTENAGKYKYGPDSTGVTFSDYKISFNGESSTDKSGTFTAFTVTDTTSAALTGTYDATAGVNSLTNKGNASSPEVKISAKNDATVGGSKTITGYRNTFYGIVTEKKTIDSAVIRGLANKTTSKLSDTSLEVENALRVIIAIPKTKPTGAKGTYNTYSGATLSKVLDVNDSNSNLNGQFTRIEVDVYDASGNSNAITYSVYYIDFANAHSKDTFKITQ